ncbi:unnamed protein product [Heligmosomoides polygyrus]|uniref:DUF5131 family protein n=1 Tax=Heligmosomoides polygyrus TaxID=6339 RepID=A0A183GBS6_HELPZ|nr:unnamed protein product [Heligmosomoides polygyrus]
MNILAALHAFHSVPSGFLASAPGSCIPPMSPRVASFRQPSWHVYSKWPFSILTAPVSGALLEKDGPRRGIATRVATTFKQLREILNEWATYPIWIIVWPLDRKFKEDEVCEVVKACDKHFEHGGRIVSAWPPIVEKNAETWKKMMEMWSILDAGLNKRAGSGQFFSTAPARIENGAVFCELGTPEDSLAFYGSDCTVGCAKILHGTIRRKTMGQVPLPELKKSVELPRTAAQGGGGMWVDRPRSGPVKRRDLGGNWSI